MEHKIIAIICAMDIELEGYKKLLQNQFVEYNLGHEFLIGDYQNNKLVITKCGIGKVNAAAITLLLIEHYNPDLLFNSGIAGGYSKKLKTLDIVVATNVVYSDVDMTSDEFTDLRYGQLQDLPLTFKPCDKTLNQVFNMELDSQIHFGTIMTGDQFVTDYRKTDLIVTNHFSDLNILACDMESCAVAHVCYLTKTPFLIVRSISDIIGSSNSFDYQTFAPIAAKNATDIVNYIIKNCK
jgi:adenosylhomocysteine nucleosidase